MGCHVEAVGEREQKGSESDPGPKRAQIPPPDPSLPNVVIVTIDTLRADHCSAYGYERETTPHLDVLASEGALFEDAHAVSATTLPSHATLFTSLYPDEHGVLKNALVLPEDVRTMAEIMAGWGYATAAFVSSFVLDRRFGMAQGFALYDDDFRGAEFSSPIRTWEGHRLEAPYDRRGRETTDRVLGWLRGRDPTRPFFLWVHYFDPHSPYDPPDAYRSRFLSTTDPGSEQWVIDLYDGDVRYVDEELGRLFHGLDEFVPGRERLTIVTSDHGEGLWEHGYLEHGVNLYEEMIRVPFVVHWPGRVPAGQRIPGLVGGIDVLPTLLGIVGLPLDGIEPRGLDLAPVVTGKSEIDADRALFVQRRLYKTGRRHHVRVAGPKRAVLWRNWKLIESPAEIGLELFDLATDADELHNLAGRRDDVVGPLRSRMTDWRTAQAKREKVEDASVSVEVRERLEALGYTE
jgi:arylsulfatase A-like enzyme